MKVTRTNKLTHLFLPTFFLINLTFFSLLEIFCQDRFSIEIFKKHLSVLGSDSLEGRGTGTTGEKIAADYIAQELIKLGLIPLGSNKLYFQNN